MPSVQSLRGKAVVRHGPPPNLRGGRNSGGGNDAPLGVPPIRGAGSFVLSPAPLAIPPADRSKEHWQHLAQEPQSGKLLGLRQSLKH